MINFYPRHRAQFHPRVERSVLTGLSANTFLRNMGLSSVALFLPIFLFNLGGMGMLVGYVVVTRFLEAIMANKMAKMVGGIGFKKSVMLGGILLALVLLSLEYARTYPLLVWAGALVVPFAALLYWIPFHLLFLETRREKLGEEAGVLSVLTRWSQVLGPVLGGLLITGGGFRGLFWWGIALVMLSILPIWFLEPDNLKWKFHLDHYWEKVSNRWFRGDLLAHVGLGLEEVLFETFWPVFLVGILGGSNLLLGGYKTGVLVVTSVVVLMMGKKMDRSGGGKLMAGASVALVMMWLVRGYLKNRFGLWALDALDGITGVLVFMPFTVYVYRRALSADRPLYVVERESAISIGRGLSGLLVGLVYVLGGGWNAMVWIGVLGIILVNLMPRVEVGKGNA